MTGIKDKANRGEGDRHVAHRAPRDDMIVRERDCYVVLCAPHGYTSENSDVNYLLLYAGFYSQTKFFNTFLINTTGIMSTIPNTTPSSPHKVVSVLGLPFIRKRNASNIFP